MQKGRPHPEGTVMIGASRSPFLLLSLLATAALLILSLVAIFSAGEQGEIRILGFMLAVVLLPIVIGGGIEWCANPRLYLLEDGVVLRRSSSEVAMPFGDVTRILWRRGFAGPSVTISFRDRRDFWMSGEGQNGQLARRLAALTGAVTEGM